MHHKATFEDFRLAVYADRRTRGKFSQEALAALFVKFDKQDRQMDAYGMLIPYYERNIKSLIEGFSGLFVSENMEDFGTWVRFFENWGREVIPVYDMNHNIKSLLVNA